MGLAATLRPRLTVRYILSAAVVLYFAVCFLFNMPLFSSALPQYSGEYDVGTIDIEAPCHKRDISDAVFRSSRKPAFRLETVLFSVYYPAVKGAISQKAKHLWVPKPVGLTAEGYARFAGINNVVTNNVFAVALWALAGSTTIPAEVDVPLHGMVKGYLDYEAEHPIDDYGLPEFPVIVFSHGMASSRTDYTHYCAELASRGYIVASIEHRDGSVPGSVVMYPDGTSRNVLHISESQLDPQPETPDFKVMQLAMRQAEIEETVRVLSEINAGFGQQTYQSNPRKEGVDLAAWKGRLNMKQVVVGGHSYGATGALQVLKGGSTEERPFIGAIILDPGKQSGPLNDDVRVPTMIVHSNSWSAKMSIFHGSPHFDVVKNLVKGIMDKQKQFAWFITARATSHPSVTDAPLIEPFLLSWTTGATVDVREGVMMYVQASQDFMRFLADGHRRGVLAEDVTHPEYDNDIRDEERKKTMNEEIERHWQVHVAPPTFCAYPGLCGVEPN